MDDAFGIVLGQPSGHLYVKTRVDGIFVVLHCEGRIEGSGEGVTDADLRQGTVAKILGHPEFAACICDGGNYQVRACVGAWVG